MLRRGCPGPPLPPRIAVLDTRVRTGVSKCGNDRAKGRYTTQGWYSLRTSIRGTQIPLVYARYFGRCAGKRTFAHRLCRQALACTRVPEQVDDEPVPLSGNEVVEFLCRAGVVRFDEGLKDLLVLRRNNELFERFVIPLEALDALDDELNCAQT